MPNWCTNHVRVTHEDKSKIDALEQAVLRSIDPEDDYDGVLNHLLPNPAGEWDYGWSLENWGTKWDVRAYNWKRDADQTLVLEFDSAWDPPITAYETLADQGWSIYALYNEPAMGFVGSWEDGDSHDYVYDFSDPDWREVIPEDLIQYADLYDAYDDFWALI